MSRNRWSIAWLLGLGVMISYTDRVNISVAQDALAHSFGVTQVGFGYLLGAYSWTYAILQLPSGVLLDRLGLRRVGGIGSFIWGLASLLSACSVGVTSMFCSRLLLGVGEAPLFPMNAKAISVWFPEKERGLPTAMFDAAAKFSPALSIPVVGLIVAHLGWRVGFGLTGVLSLVYCAIFLSVYTPGPSLPVSSLSGIGTVLKQREFSIREMLGRRKVLGVAIGSATYNYSFYLLLTWLPSYVAQELRLGRDRSVFAASIPWFFAGAVDLIVGGWLVDVLIRRGASADRVRRSILLGGMTLGLCIAAPAFTTRPVAALVFLSLGLAGLAASAPILWSLPGILVPPSSTGRLGSIVNLGGQISALAAPVVTGYLSGRANSFGSAFAVAGVLLLIGIASYAFLLGRIEPIEMSRVVLSPAREM
jgi:ACS family D-galactonate transporter-like MFS transporter